MVIYKDKFLKDKRTLDLMAASPDRLALDIIGNMFIIRRREGNTQEYLTIGGSTLPDYSNYEDFTVGALRQIKHYIIENIERIDYTQIGVRTQSQPIDNK